jgi:hypothetical protein
LLCAPPATTELGRVADRALELNRYPFA